VTGLEPGTNFPNPRSYEESQGLVVSLAPNASIRFDLAIEHLAGTALTAARADLAARAERPPVIQRQPKAGWSRA
jgi:hypothetical protein